VRAALTQVMRRRLPPEDASAALTASQASLADIGRRPLQPVVPSDSSPALDPAPLHSARRAPFRTLPRGNGIYGWWWRPVRPFVPRGRTGGRRSWFSTRRDCTSEGLSLPHRPARHLLPAGRQGLRIC